MTLLTRILSEKRAVIAPLGLALAINAGVWALVVRPLAVKSRSAAERAAAAGSGLAAAERDRAAARTLIAGKTQAEDELSTFYNQVLPANLSAARRLTYATLPSLARSAGVTWDERRTEIELAGTKDRRLGRLRIRMVLEGDYDNLRRFIYELEDSASFVIIDDVTLAQNDVSKPLLLTLELSTYYRLEANGD